MCYGCRGSESVVWDGEMFQGIGGSVISGLCKVCKRGGEEVKTVRRMGECCEGEGKGCKGVW